MYKKTTAVGDPGEKNLIALLDRIARTCLTLSHTDISRSHTNVIIDPRI